MTERANIADILCIGCQKGSTSWLHSVLNHHPKTWAFPDSEPITSTDKEAHFWDWNHERGTDWYRSLLTPQYPDQLSMDFTPEYALMSDNQIAECKQLNPTASVIYILRDPLARTVSALRMSMLWNLGKDHKKPLSLDEQFFTFLTKARVAQHGDYMRNVTAWRKHYPDLTLINYEEFHTNRENSVSDTFARLGLDEADITGEAAESLAALMKGRVWQSEKFQMERPVLMFLEGLVWRTRKSVESELGMRFTEGAEMLGV